MQARPPARSSPEADASRAPAVVTREQGISSVASAVTSSSASTNAERTTSRPPVSSCEEETVSDPRAPATSTRNSSRSRASQTARRLEREAGGGELVALALVEDGRRRRREREPAGLEADEEDVVERAVGRGEALEHLHAALDRRPEGDVAVEQVEELAVEPLRA